MIPRKPNIPLISPVNFTKPLYAKMVPIKPETIVKIDKTKSFILRIFLRISIVYTSIIEYTSTIKKYS